MGLSAQFWTKQLTLPQSSLDLLRNAKLECVFLLNNTLTLVYINLYVLITET